MSQFTVSSPDGAVCSVDHHASAAGVSMLRAGGNAVDAAIATSAALAVTTQHMCGLGGDLFALVHHGPATPDCLNASGRAGSGADPDGLRAEGATTMPFRDDIRSVPVPGCVDGWSALHARHGRLPFADVLAPAIALAAEGFDVPAHLARSARRVADVPGAEDYRDLAAGGRLVRSAVAEGLRTIATEGRDGWYRGAFGDGLIALGDGLYGPEDLERNQADWVDPLGLDLWGHRVWTVPPNSQGYLSLLAAGILQGVDLGDPESAQWAHLHIEAARLAGHDRPDVLSDTADGEGLLDPALIADRRARLDPERAVDVGGSYGDGGTIYLCTTDRDGMGVSLIQSNASGFGAHIVVPGTGVFLHNRGLGFNLIDGHPAEFRAGRRPPHTLSPALVTHPDGSLRTVLGTMGGDAQPQIVLQMLSRLLEAGVSAGEVVARPRWVLESRESDGFNTWAEPDAVIVIAEPEGASWVDGLRARGHDAVAQPVNAGHAHLIDIDATGVHHGAAETRIDTAAALSP
ncbi:MAG: gamma-glutamyltransferase [Actinomycetota bacterium]